MRLPCWISLLLALSAAPAAADSYPVEFEGVRMDVPYGDYNDCARDAEATVQLPADHVLSDPDALQSLVRGLAEKSRETCGSTMSYTLTLRGTGATKQVKVFSHNYWNLPEASLDNAARAALMTEMKEAMTDLRNGPPNADAEMAYRGYERALLVHEEPRFNLYAAVAGSQDEQGELVMVHRVPASDPFLPTKVGFWGKNHRTVQLAPEFYDVFDRGLANAGPFAGHYLVRHYLQGYYQPVKNRAAVLAKDGVVEHPLQRHNFSTFWDGTRLRATPIPRQYLHEFGNEESLVIDRERAEIEYGPSAPGPDGTVVAATAQVSVSPEGPSAKHLYRMRLIRESAQEKRLIYRNDAYWTQFNSDDLRRIFNAHGNTLPWAIRAFQRS